MKIIITKVEFTPATCKATARSGLHYKQKLDIRTSTKPKLNNFNKSIQTVTNKILSD